ncbi:MAG: alpha-mannosidase [Armatimonadetes bacterium]|nr:alpha-mannosidase [Armatimonadota bacterium]
MAGCTLHVISHSHWDREWYMPFELHRRRLVKLMDDLLDVFDNDPEFGSFHLDGQSIPLEDYLQVRPSQRERLVAAAQARRLTVGPWYVLQDEFLTSAEAQVRNMMYGLQVAREFGDPLRVGYLADAFGHIGQMPAILAGFGIDNAVFGRGLKTRDASLPADLPVSERGYPSELTWRGADGTDITAIYMANWYANAMDIPSEPEACAARMEAIRAGCLRFATTSHLLLMNGCDHTPCQLNISALLATARERLDDVILHSRLDDYVAAVLSEQPDLPVATGELRSERTDGWSTLTNVLSARLYLKQANWRCQHALERYLEPLSAVCGLAGAPVDRDQRRYLWKHLLENHPHDSICGCSVDPVHREMETRFAKVEDLADQLIIEQMDAVAAGLDTTCLADGEVAIVVHNPLAFDRSDLVQAEVSFPDGTELDTVALRDADGNEVEPAWVEDQGRVWDYTLPDDRFREAFYCRRLTVAFEARVPAFGCAVFRARPATLAEPEVAESAGVLENGSVCVALRPGGLLDITDKATGRTWTGLNQLVLGGDEGDEYIYRAPEGDVEHPLRGHDYVYWNVDPSGRRAEAFDLWVLGGEDGDAREVVGVSLLVSLPTDGPRVEVEARLHNDGARCFRVRALFPTDASATTAAADGHFEVVDRAITPWSGWTNPSNCQPCLDFVDVSDDTGGITVANRGLPEYEVLRDGRNTIAVTLLRAVDRVGDWGDFPTPEAQCDGENVAEYAIIAHTGSLTDSGADLEARAYNTPLLAAQTDRHAGRSAGSWLRLAPSRLVLSAVRWAEDREAFIVRFYNPYGDRVEATVANGLGLSHAWRCRLDEERVEDLGQIAADGLALSVGPREIATLELA